MLIYSYEFINTNNVPNGNVNKIYIENLVKSR